jgi:serine/threonine protein kinase
VLSPGRARGPSASLRAVRAPTHLALPALVRAARCRASCAFRARLAASRARPARAAPARANSGEVKVSDFGCVGSVDAETGEDAGASTFVGTLPYMAPERIHGNRYSYASDVWSVGLTILECARGYFPYAHCNGYFAVLSAVVHEPSPVRATRRAPTRPRAARRAASRPVHPAPGDADEIRRPATRERSIRLAPVCTPRRQ